MISASYNEHILQEAFKLGIVDYIAKPYNNNFFLGRIRSILNVYTKLTDLQHRELRLENTNQKMVNDLTIAKKLQTQLLPTGFANQHISIHGIYLPFEFLGGDFYYWQPISPGVYGIVLLDVMGHGTATSLICMYLRSLLPELMRSSTTPEILIQLLNQYLIDFNTQLTMPYHCTAFYMMVNTITHQIKYVNAGHPYVAYFDEHQEVHWLEDGCIPLGIFDRLKIKSGTLSF
jgi:sigma-B regulation protein RsbU (phosphoserine phosphatase)